mgnify:CR=1 FL=1
MASQTYKVEVFEAGNPNDENKGVEYVYAKDGRSAVAKVRARVNQECGAKWGPKLAYRLVKE